MTTAILVTVTCADAAEAERLVEAAVGERLAACGTIVPNVRSIYHWQGRVCRTGETLILLKTRAALFEPLRRRLRALHSYAVPEIVALPLAAGDADYLAWIDAETRAPGDAVTSKGDEG